MSRVAPHAAEMPSASLDGHNIEVVFEDDHWHAHPGLEEAVEKAIAALLSSAAPGVASLEAATVLMGDDAHVTSLNRAFRDQPKPTNVLSFPAMAEAAEPNSGRYAGDVIIARETVEREALEIGIPVLHHVQHLVIHGLLHLVGYDHVDDKDAVRMEALETRILATLGIADPYAD